MLLSTKGADRLKNPVPAAWRSSASTLCPQTQTESGVIGQDRDLEDKHFKEKLQIYRKIIKIAPREFSLPFSLRPWNGLSSRRRAVHSGPGD